MTASLSLPPEFRARLARSAALLRAERGGPACEDGPQDASPGALAAWVTGGREMQARHLDLVDEAFVDIAAGTCDRVMLTMPPRHGKSRRASRWGPLWYLRKFPDHRVALASYGAELANEHGRWARDTIELYGGYEGTLDIGLRLRPTSKAANRWDLVGHDGGMVTTGIGGVLTGRGMHLGICDDPFKDAADASSPTIRRRAWDWWQSTFLTRLEPGGAVILILTRWHDDDIAGRLLADVDEASRWRVINLPALAETDDDPLGRRRGEALWPERYDEEALAEIRRRVGGRVWNALYQQRPAPPEGAVWKRSWIGYCAPDQVPPSSMTVVAIDPAVTSADTSDDTGIIVACRGSGNRADEAFILTDETCHESPAGWGRTACLAALRWSADCFVAEGNQGQEMVDLVLRTAWAELRREGKTGGRAMPAVYRVTAKVNKRLRAEPVAALDEQGGRIHHAGEFADLEDQMCAWTGEGDSPDRLDARVYAITYLLKLGGPASVGDPGRERQRLPTGTKAAMGQTSRRTGGLSSRDIAMGRRR